MHVKKLLEELKERHLYRVAVLYVAGAWLGLQVIDIIGENFEWPIWLMQGLILVMILGLPVVLLAAWMSGEPKPVDTPAEAPVANTDDRPSLLILPFDCFSDRPEDVWNADALTEDLTTLLARFSDYCVIARNTAFAFKGKSVDVREFKDKLGVRYVLEGSLRRRGQNLRINAQLVETATGGHLWAEKYDWDETDFEPKYDEFLQAVVMKLGNELTRAEMHLSRTRPPGEWSVLELYQQARGVLQFEGWSQQSLTHVVDLLRQAIAKDPEFAPAQAYLSLVLAIGYWLSLYPDREAAHTEALKASEIAMTLAPESSEVLGFAGCALSDLGQHDRGIPILERAVELNPSNSQAFAALGVARVLCGNIDDGMAHLRHAMEISPLDPGLAPWSTVLSFAETLMGDATLGLESAQRACKADPRYYGGFLAMGLAQVHLGRLEEAQRSVAESRRLNPDLSEESAAAMVGEEAIRELEKVGITLPGLKSVQATA